jgi:hypothetical protein
MSNKERYDWSIFSDVKASLDLWGKSIRRSVGFDEYVGNQVFKARALTDMFPLSAKSTMPLDGASSGGAGGGVRYAFKARIIGNNTPHSFLQDPCDPAYTGDEDLTYKLISMHTTFISATVNEGQSVTRGDLVLVELKKTDQSYDLKYGRFLSLSSPENPGEAKEAECYSLKSLVGGWAPNDMGTSAGAGGAVGSTSTPRPEYPPCEAATHGITKKWIETPISEFAKTVKAQVTDQTLAIAIIAVAIQEQGKGSNITGYNYNRYGIMADLKGSWGTGKIKCSVPSTEGAGGSGDRREKNRWFAAFASEADGIDFMVSALRAKGFDKATDAETFVKLHIDKWLSPSNKKTRIESAESKWVNYRKKKEAHWTNAKTYYDKVA